MFFLHDYRMFGLVDIEQCFAGTSVLNSVGESFIIIISFKVKKTKGRKAGGGHDFGNVNVPHPAHPIGVYVG